MSPSQSSELSGDANAHVLHKASATGLLGLFRLRSNAPYAAKQQVRLNSLPKKAL